ncbi:hypothetical protein CEXT_281831 [Caerostris extrusa]|uniref:Uncharacterized protein n=1 Tax=Caerostris extrusa TaxID=172846 RepID=A0AAV4XCN1_CAEEX|nr:hypothetical protein CEXT_281831 [Caerostris extrusa]
MAPPHETAAKKVVETKLIPNARCGLVDRICRQEVEGFRLRLDWLRLNRRDPLEVELLGYGFILLILYFHLFMICIRLQPIFTLLITGGYCRHS